MHPPTGVGKFYGREIIGGGQEVILLRYTGKSPLLVIFFMRRSHTLNIWINMRRRRKMNVWS